MCSSNRILSLLPVFMILLLVTACPRVQGPAPKASITLVKFTSQEVQKGTIPESGTMTLNILLPPSYGGNTTKRYPVVYALHGWGMSPGTLATSSQLELEAAWQAGTCPEFIMVGIPGTNRLGGSFYMDSPATGNWQSLVAQEIVSWTDTNYRTRPESGARMVAGYSMGGYGAWNMGLEHPDIFAHAWACCPMAIAPTDPKAVFAAWDATRQQAFGAAFAPDLSVPQFFTQVPDAQNTPENNALVASWFDASCNMDIKLPRYAAQAGRLANIRFAFARQDENPWLVEGVQYVAEAMKNAGLPVQIKGFDTYHTISVPMVMESFIPLLQDAFGPYRQ